MRRAHGQAFWIIERACDQVDIIRVTSVPEHHRALHLSPRNFARFIGESLKATRNSSDVITRSACAKARASLPASSARDANSGRWFGRANFTFHGHTSWEVWRHTHFEIPLASGVGTLAKRSLPPADGAACLGHP